MKRRTFLKALMWTGFTIKSNIFDVNIFIKEKLQKIKPIDISDESTEGGTVTCFIDGDILSKIEVDQCFETGRYFKKILLNNDGSIFRVDELVTRYNAPFNLSEDIARELAIEAFDLNKSKITTNTYHFRNDEVSQYASSSSNTIDTIKIAEQCKKRVNFVLSKMTEPAFYA
jgi:hypothetical protein